MDGQQVIAAYHDLWQVETVLPDDQVRPTRPADVPPPARGHRSPPDRRVRRPRDQPAPAGHDRRDLKKLVRALRPLRSVDIAIGDQTITADPQPDADARDILDRLPPISPGH